MAKLGSFNYDRFNKLFHKGEQIVVGFREDYTHGYITKIDKTGFGLYQIEQPKEYWYDWEHFEVVMHPGFRFKKLPQVSEQWVDNVNAITIKLLGNRFPNPSKVDDIGIHYQWNNTEDVIACVDKFNVELKDIVEFDPQNPWGDIKLKINNGFAEMTTKNRFVNTLPKELDFDIVKLYMFEGQELEFEGDGVVSKAVRDNQELEIMRMTKLGERVYVSSGDPWYTDEPVEVIGFNMWKSKDGYAMSHSKAILIEVVCR